MPKFTLIAEHTDLNGTPDGTKVNYEFHCDFLPEVLEHMDLFLRGCGFAPTGTLDYVDEFAETNMDFGLEQDWDTLYTGDGHDGMGSTLDDYPELKTPHSEYYYDVDRNKPASPWPFPINGESK
jgi:hypothetical protein